MSDDYEQTRLWQDTLAPRPGDSPADAAARQRLNQAYRDLRARAARLADEIPRTLPGFTDHSVRHFDKLWSLADRIAGPGVSLTPAEAFVLGGAFLVHDLALSLPAYPGGAADLMARPEWKDTVAQLLARRLGRAPTGEEIARPDDATVRAALAELIRDLHAPEAVRVATEGWTDPTTGDTFFLIDAPEVRRAFGGWIGAVAASHGKSLGAVRQEFAVPAAAGAPAGYPPGWTIDRVKLACLLRAADAAHLDAGRAPLFLRALRRPAGVSAAHWAFQGQLAQPTTDNNRLVFTAGAPGFPYREAQAWWLCLDTLRAVDEELRQVDDLFVSLGRGYRFDARGVEGVHSLDDFARLVPTDGWEPVDTRVHVTDVAGLVRSLGGRQLYGDDRYVPLRELIQNGCDAVRARRLLQTRKPGWGEVAVRFGRDDSGPWVEVEDTGVGMSTRVLKGPLLDFGVSFWGTPEMRREHPGLQGKGFESVGKYGIGFFSVFMWGERVRVVTRRFDAAVADTTVLTFDAGLDSRPVLRKASADEQLQDGGTRVRVWCQEPHLTGESNLGGPAAGWVKRLGWLCPTLDVTLQCEYLNEPPVEVVRAGDWESMDGAAFLRRVFEHDSSLHGLPVPNPGAVLAPLSEGGRLVGRALIAPEGTRSDPLTGVVTVGGMRAGTLFKVAGSLVGRTATASRKHAVPIASQAELCRWALDQADRFVKLGLGSWPLSQVAQVVAALGGDVSGFATVRSISGSVEVTMAKVREIAAGQHTILIADTGYSGMLDLPVRDVPYPPPLPMPAFEASTNPPVLLPSDDPREVWPPLPAGVPLGRARLGRTVAGALIEAVAAAWGADVNAVLAASGFDPESGRFVAHQEAAVDVVGQGHESNVGEQIFVIRKP